MNVNIRPNCTMCGSAKYHISQWYADGECVAVSSVWRICDKCHFMENVTLSIKEEEK